MEEMKQRIIDALEELYELTTKTNSKEIYEKRVKALMMLAESGIGYTEGYNLFRRYSHSIKEFYIIMQHARPILLENDEKKAS